MLNIPANFVMSPAEQHNIIDSKFTHKPVPLIEQINASKF